MTLLADPFAPMFELSRDFDRLFSRPGVVRSFVPAADILVSDDAVDVYMDVPGFGVDDLDIELVDNTLTVRGERNYPYAMNGNGNGNGDKRVWQRLERGFGKFERVLRVPDGLDADAITASMDAGVLTLHIAKPEAKRPRKIQIGGGAQPAIEQESDTTAATADDRELVGATA